MQNTKLLLILDGWGYSSDTSNNAIALANTPNWDCFLENYPNTLIGTSGESVGLPDGQMGNSEVGHLTIGSGRIIEQDFTRIDNDIKSGEFFSNAVLPKYHYLLRVSVGSVLFEKFQPDLQVPFQN